MDPNFNVNACISVRDGCAMKYLVNADEQIEFTFGSTRYPFELVFDLPALRHFMELAGSALTQVAVSIVHGDKNGTDQTDEKG